MLEILFLKDCRQTLPDFLSLLVPIPVPVSLVPFLVLVLTRVLVLVPMSLVLVPVLVRESVLPELGSSGQHHNPDPGIRFLHSSAVGAYYRTEVFQFHCPSQHSRLHFQMYQC